MKTKILLVILLLPALQTFSQVTLTNNINPAAGNQEMSVECDTNGITHGNAGVNQTWNFTSLSRLDSNLLTWVSAASTPYSSQFPTSDVASTMDDKNYNFFKTSSVNLFTTGTAFPGEVISDTDPELYMQYPFTYNSTFTDNFTADYNIGYPVHRTGTITVTSDAWGTINLPFGSFSNALRVKYTVITKDSSNQGTPVIFTTTLNSYVWFVPGKKFPVFEVIYTSTDFNGISFGTTKNVNYNSNSTPIGISPISSEVPDNFSLKQNYPNPFNPSTNIEFLIADFGPVNITVYDIQGKNAAELVNEELKPGTYKINFDGSSLPSGVYFYRLTSKDFSETKKMILVK